MKAHIVYGRDYTTERPVAVGCIEMETGYVVLAMRFLDGDEPWFPTWLGHPGETVQVPRGFALPPEMVTLLDKAPPAEGLGS